MWRQSLARSFGLLIAVLLTALSALVGCGSEDSAASGEPSVDQASFNDADVAFAHDMIVHHSKALDMVALTEAREMEPELQAVVDGIKAAQAPEIEHDDRLARLLGPRCPGRQHGNDGHG